MRTDDSSRAVNSTDLVKAYAENPRTSKAIAQRLTDLTNNKEHWHYGDLQRIIAEENARTPAFLQGKPGRSK